MPSLAASRRFIDTVDVDGRALGLSCFGRGSPSVVLVAGLTRPSDVIWPRMVEAVSPVTRVCVFDRAGMGPSDPAPTVPQTAADVVIDLHAALAKAGEAGPHVLVGFSIGGPFVRLYASTHPTQVAGLVLIDPVPLGTGYSARVIEILEEVGAADEVMKAERRGFDPDLPAPIDSNAADRQLQAAPAPPTVPVVVLVRGTLDPDPIPELETLWQEANAALARELGAHVVVAEQSGHFVPIDQPEFVVTAIHTVVAAVRAPRLWATPVTGPPTP